MTRKRYKPRGSYARRRYQTKGDKEPINLADKDWKLGESAQKRLCAVCGGLAWAGDTIYVWNRKAAHVLCLNNIRQKPKPAR